MLNPKGPLWGRPGEERWILHSPAVLLEARRHQTAPHPIWDPTVSRLPAHRGLKSPPKSEKLSNRHVSSQGHGTIAERSPTPARPHHGLVRACASPCGASVENFSGGLGNQRTRTRLDLQRPCLLPSSATRLDLRVQHVTCPTVSHLPKEEMDSIISEALSNLQIPRVMIRFYCDCVVRICPRLFLSSFFTCVKLGDTNHIRSKLPSVSLEECGG